MLAVPVGGGLTGATPSEVAPPTTPELPPLRPSAPPDEGPGLRFEPNQGQADPAVDYIGRGSGLTVSVSGSEIHVRAQPSAASPEWASERTTAQAWNFSFEVRNGRASPTGTLAGSTTAETEYVLPDGGSITVPTAPRLLLEEVRPGVDLVLKASPDGDLKYDIRLDPGLDGSAFQLAFHGLDDLQMIPSGALQLDVGNETIIQPAPVTFQPTDEGRERIDAQYEVAGETIVGVELGPRDPTLPTVIDPKFETSMRTTSHEPEDVALLPDGGILTVGSRLTDASDGDRDAVLVRYDPDGNRIYRLVLVGSKLDVARGIALSQDRATAFLVGDTFSKDLPGTEGGAFSEISGGRDAFVSRIALDAGDLEATTYLGGSTGDFGTGVAVHPTGDLVVGGNTASEDLPTSPAALQPSYAGGAQDAFLARLPASLGELDWLTYLGGSDPASHAGEETLEGVGIGEDGGILAGGGTPSQDLPTVNAFQPQPQGGRDGWFAGLTANGTSARYVSYLGGSSHDYVEDATVGAGSLYLVGATFSYSSFPTQKAREGWCGGGSADAFATKVEPDGDDLVYSTPICGFGTDGATAVGTWRGFVGVTGLTRSKGNLWQTDDTFSFRQSNARVFGGLLNPSGQHLVYGEVWIQTDRNRPAAASMNSDGALGVVVEGGSQSDSFLRIGLVPPGPPEDLRAISIAGTGQVKLTWDDADDGDFPYLSTRVYREPLLSGGLMDPRGEETQVGGIGPSFTDEGLTSGRYRYEVSAVSLAGEGTASEPVEVTVVDGHDPNPPAVEATGYAVLTDRPTGCWTRALFTITVDLTSRSAVMELGDWMDGICVFWAFPFTFDGCTGSHEERIVCTEPFHRLVLEADGELDYDYRSGTVEVHGILDRG